MGQIGKRKGITNNVIPIKRAKAKQWLPVISLIISIMALLKAFNII